MRTDPLIVACPLCGQPPDERCLRQSGYGHGAPLRRMHRERYEQARLELRARRERSRTG